jgi:hypothetical protein
VAAGQGAAARRYPSDKERYRRDRSGVTVDGFIEVSGPSSSASGHLMMDFDEVAAFESWWDTLAPTAEFGNRHDVEQMINFEGTADQALLHFRIGSDDARAERSDCMGQREHHPDGRPAPYWWREEVYSHVRVRSTLILGGLVTLTMAAAIVYGIASGGFVNELRDLLDAPWGRVTLIDLFLGFVIFGAWIGWREQSVVRSAPWWIALALTGNLAAGFYLFLAARKSASVEEFLLGNRA